MAFGYGFEEVEGSPRESVDLKSGWTMTREFRVPWSSRITFVEEMALWPYPGWRYSRAYKFSVSPESTDVGNNYVDPRVSSATYSHARVVITYEPLSEGGGSEQADGSVLEYQRSSETEFLTIPGRALLWEDNDEPVSPDANAAILIPKRKHVYTWSQLASPNWGLMQAYEGAANNAPVTLPLIGITCPVETLLFEGAEAKGSYSISGSTQWDLTMSFAEKRITSYSGSSYGWNHSYRDDPPGWIRTVDEDGGRNYFGAPLGDLFL